MRGGVPALLYALKLPRALTFYEVIEDEED